jgi:hypothetical protein
VPRQLGKQVRVVRGRFECLHDAPVHPGPPPRGQHGAQRLPHQVVAEAQPDAARRPVQHAGVEGGSQLVERGIDRHAGDRGDQPEIHVRPDDGGDLEQLPAAGGQPGDPAPDDVAGRGRDA